MRGGLTRRGYTIIEVMIFLAVSGLMFLIAAAFVSGKESAVQFRQSMNNINSQVQQVINNVINGYYPSSSTFNCTANSGVLQFDGTGTNAKGANGGISVISGEGGCVFLGQVIQIGAGSSGQDPTHYSVFTVAGSQYVGGGTGPALPTTFATADPTVVFNGSTVDLTQDDTFQGGMTANSMFNSVFGSPPQYLAGIGFFGSFGTSCSGSGSSTLLAGAQSLCVVGYPGIVDDLTSGNTQLNMRDHIDNGIYSIAVTPSDPVILNSPDVTICFSGGSGQYGTLTIGDISGQHLATSVQISSNNISGC